MKTIDNTTPLKFGWLWLAMFLLAPAAWAGTYQHGTVVRMRMGPCMAEHHGFMMAMSGGGPQNAPDICPEYTLLSDRVAYVIVGKSSNQLVPLADEIDFRLQNTEMAVRVDDAKRESKFAIKEMILRTEWDLIQKHIVEQLSAPAGASGDDLLLRSTR
jgi:hypothetical protein